MGTANVGQIASLWRGERTGRYLGSAANLALDSAAMNRYGARLGVRFRNQGVMLGR